MSHNTASANPYQDAAALAAEMQRVFDRWHKPALIKSIVQKYVSKAGISVKLDDLLDDLVYTTHTTVDPHDIIKVVKQNTIPSSSRKATLLTATDYEQMLRTASNANDPWRNYWTVAATEYAQTVAFGIVKHMKLSQMVDATQRGEFSLKIPMSYIGKGMNDWAWFEVTIEIQPGVQALSITVSADVGPLGTFDLDYIQMTPRQVSPDMLARRLVMSIKKVAQHHKYTRRP